MKKLSPFEKKILKRIVAEGHITFPKFISSFLPGVRIDVNIKDRSARIVYGDAPEYEFENSISTLKEIMRVLKKLDQEEYITFDTWLRQGDKIVLGDPDIKAEGDYDALLSDEILDQLLKLCPQIIRAKVKAEKYMKESSKPSGLIRRTAMFVGSALLLVTGVETGLVVNHWIDKPDRSHKKTTIEVVEPPHVHTGPQTMKIDRFVDSTDDSITVKVTVTENE